LIGIPTASNNRFDLATGRLNPAGNIVDPSAEIARTCEAIVGFQHELIRNLAVGVDYIYRKYDRGTTTYTIGYQPGAPGYPLSQIYTGPLYYTDSATGLSAPYYQVCQGCMRPTNLGSITMTNPNYQVYQGVDFTATKRYSNRWQMQAAFTRRTRFRPIHSTFPRARRLLSIRPAGTTPDSYIAFENLGQALRERGRLDEAAAHYQRALELAPAGSPVYQAVIYNSFGLVRTRQGREDMALGAFEAAARLNPRFAEAQSNLGNALAAAGRFGEAVDHYRAAVEMKPDFTEALVGLGSALVSQNKAEDAIVPCRINRAEVQSADRHEAHARRAFRTRGP
jgi:tetratricopeptide (TPR) repeat protein